jgi:hypothetical protein
MLKKFTCFVIVVIFGLTSMQALAAKKLADEAGGGSSGGGGGPKGGMNSAAAQKGMASGNAKLQKEVSGAARSGSKRRDEKVMNNRGVKGK